MWGTCYRRIKRRMFASEPTFLLLAYAISFWTICITGISYGSERQVSQIRITVVPLALTPSRPFIRWRTCRWSSSCSQSWIWAVAQLEVTSVNVGSLIGVSQNLPCLSLLHVLVLPGVISVSYLPVFGHLLTHLHKFCQLCILFP